MINIIALLGISAGKSSWLRICVLTLVGLMTFVPSASAQKWVRIYDGLEINVESARPDGKGNKVVDIRMSAPLADRGLVNCARRKFSLYIDREFVEQDDAVAVPRILRLLCTP